MNDRLLNPEELAALRDDGAAAAPVPEEVDLTGGHRLVRKAGPQLERALGRLTESLGQSLTRRLRGTCTVQSAPAEIIGSDAVRHIVDRAALAVPLARRGEVLGWLCPNAVLAFTLVEATFGGSVKGPVWEATRAHLTALERLVLRPLIVRWVADLSRSLCADGTPLDPGEDPGQADTLPARVDAAWLGQIELQLGERSAACQLVFLPTIAAHLGAHRGPQAQAPVRDWLAQHLGRVPVDVVPLLGEAELKLSTLAALKPGDVIRLDRAQADPLTLLVGEITKFAGRPRQQAGTLAIEIVTERP